MSDLETRVKNLEDKMVAILAMSVPVNADIDGQYGDPEVRKDPPQWKGESYQGQKFSACSPEYLDSLASFCDWKAGKNLEDVVAGKPDADKYLRYARTDAARARAWAARKRRPLAEKAMGVAEPTNEGSAWDAT